MLSITCISDTHTLHRGVKFEKTTDVLIHSGDIVCFEEDWRVYEDFLDWMASLPHQHKVFIAGNHDTLIQDDPGSFQILVNKYKKHNIHYLQLGSVLFPSSVNINGYNFTGSPWTPHFYNWAFNFTEDEVGISDSFEGFKNLQTYNHWNKIPFDTHVLITHGPEYSVLDHVGARRTGCPLLGYKMKELKNLRLHAFGHIHVAYGHKYWSRYESINASLVDSEYKLSNLPIYTTINKD